MSNYQNNSEPDKPSILIVDDERIARDIFEGHLASEGYKLVFAVSGFQALEYLENKLVDLILLDIMMPHMDGIQVCQRIKADERLKHIPVIMITGYADHELEGRTQAVGAELILEKPIKGSELRTLLQFMLSS